MKIGIYISGLGQSFQQESVVKYTTRLMNEMNYNNTGINYALKTEKATYGSGKECNVVSIMEENGETKKTIFKMYDFEYHNLLTDKFSNCNIFVRSFSLLFLVLKKIPILTKRLFVSGHYNQPVQTVYIFLMFFAVAASILFTIPAVLQIMFNALSTPEVQRYVPLGLNAEWIKTSTDIFVSFVATILVLLPKSRSFVTRLSTEFICINDYIEFGAQSQEVLGNLDLLVEYIAENEPGSKIHYHTYSCGSIIAIDYLFQFGNVPSGNSQKLSELLITVGSPYEFVKAYYPHFYEKRNNVLEKQITWINVYSIADALATNFRKDASRGEAQFGFPDFKELKPHNINYEVSPVKGFNLFNFLSLYSLKIHNMYWDPSVEGQSCIRLIHNELKTRNMLV